MKTSYRPGVRTPQRALEMREALRERGLSERSARVYQAEMWRIEQWVGERGYTVKNVPAAVLEEFVKSRPKTWSTRKLIRSALMHYWAIVGRKNPPLWVVRTPRKPTGRCRALEPEDARALARAARQRGDREGVAVLFGLYAGLRREEIANVRWEDIRPDGWLYVYGKGDKPAEIPLHPALIHALTKLPHTSEWVFCGQSGKGPVAPTTVWTWVLRVSEEVLGRRVNTHVLRHTCLATANDNTGDLRAVQELARHARPETTAIYTRATARRLQAAVAALDY